VTPEILPDCRARDPKGEVQTKSGYQTPIFCGSCGVHAGWCPAETKFLFYTCPGCFATYGPLTNVMYMPDEIFFQKVQEAQEEKYGHALNAVETEIMLGDPNSLESQLASSRAALTPKAGA
jgi:hypothetical protein